MKIKTLSAMTEKGLDKKVNEFLSAETMEPIQVEDIKFSTGSGVFAVLIVYKS